jgi:CRISPR-associated protein Cas6
MIVDVSFVISCQTPLPADHGYILYSALSRSCPELYSENGIAVHPLCGQLIAPRQLQLQPWSRLVLRAESQRIPALIGLAGKQLNLADRPLRVGIPQVIPLIAAPTLRSRLVTTKHGQDEDRFRTELRRQLDALHVAAEVQPLLGKRRTLRIKDKEVVGHEVLLEGLSAEESLTVQEVGLGGRRHMGCGVFVPVTSRKDTA